MKEDLFIVVCAASGLVIRFLRVASQPTPDPRPDFEADERRIVEIRKWKENHPVPQTWMRKAER